MAEALQMKIDRKSLISLQRGQFDPKIHAEGSSLVPPPTFNFFFSEN